LQKGVTCGDLPTGAVCSAPAGQVAQLQLEKRSLASSVEMARHEGRKSVLSRVVAGATDAKKKATALRRDLAVLKQAAAEQAARATESFAALSTQLGGVLDKVLARSAAAETARVSASLAAAAAGHLSGEARAEAAAQGLRAEALAAALASAQGDVRALQVGGGRACVLLSAPTPPYTACNIPLPPFYDYCRVASNHWLRTWRQHVQLQLTTRLVLLRPLQRESRCRPAWPQRTRKRLAVCARR
jgi:hypothetical protein